MREGREGNGEGGRAEGEGGRGEGGGEGCMGEEGRSGGW